MDWLNEGLTRSTEFFNAHGLTSLAAALPQSLALDEAAQSKAAAARQVGLTEAFVFPPYKLLQEQTPALVQQLANTPGDNLPASHQYTESWVQDMNELAACAARNRGESAYILLYGPGKFPEETRNLTADQLDKLFNENNWTGVAAHEYLVLQRVYSEINGDHRFDDYVSDTQRSQWMWLLDSRVPKGVVMGYWNPAKKRVELGWCKANNKNEKRGSHPTVVIPV